MRCKCGGIMRPMMLTVETCANVCILCGRDDLPRQIGHVPEEPDQAQLAPVSVKPWKAPRTCPGCQRPGLIFSGKCQRCYTRESKGLDLITGKPVVDTPPAFPSLEDINNQPLQPPIRTYQEPLQPIVTKILVLPPPHRQKPLHGQHQRRSGPYMIHLPRSPRRSCSGFGF